MIHKSYWVFCVLEYPRLQKLVIIIPVLAAWMYYEPFSHWFYTFCFVSLCLCVVYLIYKISPYTMLNRKEMKKVPAGTGEALSIFAANVYQDNTQYEKILSQINETDPDIVFLLETDKKWQNVIQVLKEKYPYSLEQPLDNTYGLLFYSRIKLAEGKVKYLVKNDIPSIDVILELPTGQLIQLYGLHPEPPVPTENPSADAKNKELMKVAFKVRDCKLPCIVFGDLNDVAWSHTTELFRKTSQLLDPRRGRGFYSTFSAKSWFIRFPLDYIFCTPDFGLVEMRRMPQNGSDHFAVFTKLAFLKKLENIQEPPAADSGELKDAKDLAAKPAS
jgi:endonuclease/exonuclease/phosphatase (EEP) superfamily protein YafD